MVILSREAGGPTLAEAETQAQEARVADARQDPDVAAILQRFPGAKITDVRIKVQEAEDEPETVEAAAVAESAEGDILPGDDIEH
jgi:DNA polymerase III subunit gamma/tau